jgi:hypothetical protein
MAAAYPRLDRGATGPVSLCEAGQAVYDVRNRKRLSMSKRTFDPKYLPITSAVATALLASACGPSNNVAKSDVAVCRDDKGARVADANCARGHGGSGMNGALLGAATWYYLSRGSVVPGMGQRVSGGFLSPRAGVNYSRASAATVTRGGFGASARGRSGGIGA